MKHKFVLIKLDETKYWNKDAISTKVGRIFGLYVADLSIAVHCCELTSSYELHFVSSQCEYLNLFDETDYESMDDYLRDGDVETELVHYMHCSSVNSLPKLDPQKGQFFPPKGSTGAIIELNHFDDEETIDDVIEYVQANGF